MPHAGITNELEKAMQENARSGGKFYVQDNRAVFEEDMRSFCRKILRTFDPTADLCIRVAGRMYAVHRAFLCVRCVVCRASAPLRSILFLHRAYR
jgi:hypothetical protein